MHWIDHNFLPDICGTVDRFIVNRHGEVDGLVLMYEPDRFLFVHLPPHLGLDITSAVAQDDAIRVRGVRPRGADVVAAVAVIASDGGLILDNGPDGKIMAQLVMIVEVLIAERNPEYPLADERRHPMLDQFRPPAVDEAIGKALDEPKPPIGRSQQQAAGVGSDGAAVKSRNHCAAFYGCKIE